MTNPKQIAGEERTLLEMAARAAGPDLVEEAGTVFWRKGLKFYEPWNPKESDADAFRLAVKLQLSITNNSQFVFASCCHHRDIRTEHVLGDDPEAATRYVITRVAAQIGAFMESA